MAYPSVAVRRTVDALLEFVTAHNGALPRRRSQDNAETSLSRAYQGLKGRCVGSIRGGTNPSTQMLTPCEVEYFNLIAQALLTPSGVCPNAACSSNTTSTAAAPGLCASVEAADTDDTLVQQSYLYTPRKTLQGRHFNIKEDTSTKLPVYPIVLGGLVNASIAQQAMGAPGGPGPATDLPKCGLIVTRKWLDLILSGQKTWEIRSTPTTKREVVALIESGSGYVLGEARITDSLVVSLTDLQNNVAKHRVEDLSIITYSKPHAWVLTEAKRYKEPQPYKHPQGAVVWLDLAETPKKRKTVPCPMSLMCEGA